MTELKMGLIMAKHGGKTHNIMLNSPCLPRIKTVGQAQDYLIWLIVGSGADIQDREESHNIIILDNRINII